MKLTNRLGWLFVVGCLLLFLAIIYSIKHYVTLQKPKPILQNAEEVAARTTPEQIFERADVKRIIDGDTIEINDDKIIRYIGIDAPEMDEANPLDKCLAIKAKNRNKELLEGKDILMSKDVSETDKYGRLLRYVWVNGKMVNEKLVEEGWAKAVKILPDERYYNLFLERQKIAESNDWGMWADSCHQ